MALDFNVKDLLRKRPFTKISPHRYNTPIVVNDINNASYYDEKPSYFLITQADYLRELDPNGHLIYDHDFYPDKIKIIEKEVTDSDGKVTKQKIPVQQKMVRVSFAFQEMIKVQQLIHLCGNDLHHELNSSDKETKDSSKFFAMFKRGWYNKQVDTHFFHFCDSIKSTGDGAIVLYMSDGKVNLKTYSYLDGDCLYQQVNPFTSKPEYFVRTFQDIDNNGTVITNYAEVWDNKCIYLLKQDAKGLGGLVAKFRGILGLDGYSLISSVAHGFNELPVVYYRAKEGACWSAVQDDIDMYELGFSHLCQNNLAFAFPILVMKGDDIQIQGDEIDGAVKGFVIGADANVDYLKAPESPESFKLELDTLLKNIFRGSHTVEPPEIKSGDTPTGTVKLIFFPAVQQAMKDAADLSESIQRLSRLFKYGYSIEAEAMTQMANLDILTWAIPYIPQNDQERINNLVQEVGAGIKSKHTASEQTGDGAYNEYELLMMEQEEANENDVLSQLKKQQLKAVNTANSTAQTAIKQHQNSENATPTANPNNGK
jgi:hypothetical protein